MFEYRSKWNLRNKNNKIHAINLLFARPDALESESNFHAKTILENWFIGALRFALAGYVNSTTFSMPTCMYQPVAAEVRSEAEKGACMIELREQLPDKGEYFLLFNTTGWNKDYKASAADLEKANQNSWLVVSAYDGNKLVGFGRVVTDLVLHAMIFDMIVLPDYQGRGIGTKILSRLVNKCLGQGIRDIQLFCAKSKRVFYEKNGFVVRTDDAPGMQLKKEMVY